MYRRLPPVPVREIRVTAGRLSRSSSQIGAGSCNGYEACVDSESQIGDDSCIGDYACADSSSRDR